MSSGYVTPETPFLNPPEVEAMRNLLLQRQPKRVLEWGSGGSTLYWSRLLPDTEWVSIEHDKSWYKRVTALDLPANARVRLLDFPDYWQLDEGKFDVIFVDGRERVRCLDAARDYLNGDGVVLLHDASRSRYEPGIELYLVHDWLVPPTGGRDPRGLMVLTSPLPAPTPPMVTSERGAMYMAYGAPACRQAKQSIASLRRWLPDLPIIIVGDDEASVAFSELPNSAVVRLDVNPFKNQSAFSFHAGRIKPLLGMLSPFNHTMYVDADTEFKTSPALGYALLDRWDFVIAEAETRSLGATFPDNATEASETARKLGSNLLLYHNSGLFFWRNNAVTSRLFQLWGQEWRRYQGWDEQVALLRALMYSEAVYLNVPYTWNCRGPEEAFMVFHRFAGKAARKFGGPEITVLNRPRGVPLPPARPMVRLEVSPGRFVKVHEGDEARALENFQRTRQGGRNGNH